MRVDLEIEVVPAYQERVNLAVLENVAHRVFETETLADGGVVYLLVTGDEQIRELNAEYRGIRRATDVLSFPTLNFTETDREFVPPGQPLQMGDVVISLPRAERQALAAGHPLEQELVELLAHGLLHLLGHDHDTAPRRRSMRSREASVVAAVTGCSAVVAGPVRSG